MKYSSEQLDALKKYYPSGDYEELFKVFPGKSKQSIREIAKRMGVKSNRPHNRGDLAGRQFGRLTVLKIDHIDEKHRVCWECICSCGKVTLATTNGLTSGNKKSCGCAKRAHRKGSRRGDHTGEHFGMLTATERLLDYKGKGNTYYRCVCDCGNEVIVSPRILMHSRTPSCGCIQKVRRETQVKEKKKTGRRPGRTGLDNGKREKPVNQYDLDGHYLRTYESIEEAKQATGARAINHVLSSCHHQTAGGFQWKYDTGNHADIPPYYRGKPVFQIDPSTNQLVSTYRSIAEAGNITGISKQEISRCCLKKLYTTGGYIWRFQADPDAFSSLDT